MSKICNQFLQLPEYQFRVFSQKKTPKIIYQPEYYLPLSLTQIIESSACRRKATTFTMLMGLNPALTNRTFSRGQIGLCLISSSSFIDIVTMTLETKLNDYSNTCCFRIRQKSVTNFLIYLSINFECFPEKTPKIIY